MICKQRKPAMLNAFDADTSATAWPVGALDLQVRHVLGARQDEGPVHLVAHHTTTVTEDDVTDPLELGAGEHPAPRVGVG